MGCISCSLAPWHHAVDKSQLRASGRKATRTVGPLLPSCKRCFACGPQMQSAWHKNVIVLFVSQLFTCCVGWTGEYCETNIDECDLSLSDSVPLCHHNGVCIDTPGSYTCNCTNTGYTGMWSWSGLILLLLDTAVGIIVLVILDLDWFVLCPWCIVLQNNATIACLSWNYFNLLILVYFPVCKLFYNTTNKTYIIDVSSWPPMCGLYQDRLQFSDVSKSHTWLSW